MRDRYFLVVLSAVVCTGIPFRFVKVWSEAESQDCYNTDEIEKCLSSIQVLTDDRKREFYMNKEELDRVCPSVNRVLLCIDSYRQRCKTEEGRDYLDSRYNHFTHFIWTVCEPGSYQKDYLLHAQCMIQISDDYEHCAHQFQQKTRGVQAKLNDQKWRPAKETTAEDDSDLGTLCCSYSDYMDCSQRIVNETCGEKTAKYVENAIYPVTFRLIKPRCWSYPPRSYQCPASSGSRNFQRALLLPVSLAMLSLYAVRTT